jgi:hypothetical protein
MAPLQSPVAKSCSHLHPGNKGKHPDSSQALEEGRVRGIQSLQSHEDEDQSEKRQRLTFIIFPPHGLIALMRKRLQLTPFREKQSKAKQSDKVPDFQSSASA